MAQYTLLLLTLFLLCCLPGLQTQSPCLWRVCDQIRMPNPRDDKVLEIYNCDFGARPGSTRCSMPQDIANLRRVAFKFRMNDVGLQSLPGDLCVFEAMTELDLQRNKLAAMPASLPGGCFDKIRYLRLNKNRLRNLDLSPLLRLASLEVLELEENPLDNLFVSEPPPKTSRLRVIKAARSQLKIVDLSLARIASLTQLDLSRNHIGRLSNRLGWDWHRGGNELQQRRRELAVGGRLGPDYGYTLRVLLRGNVYYHGFRAGRLWGVDFGISLTEREKVLNAMLDFQRLFGFVSLEVGGGRVECDCYAEESMLFLRQYLTPTKRRQVGLVHMDPLVNLKCQTPQPYRQRSLINLSRYQLYCQRRTNCPSRCSCMEFMNGSYLAVNCTGAGLSALPTRLPLPLQAHATYELLLAGNNISRLLLPAPSYAHRVSRLDLRRNGILDPGQLAPVLASFKRLSELDLRSNPVRRLSPELLRLADAPTPHVVRLTAERLDCRCEYFHLKQLRRVLKFFPNLYDRHCHLKGHRYRVHDFRSQFCRQTPSRGDNSVNGTNQESGHGWDSPLFSDNGWLVIVVGAGAAVVISMLVVVAVIILCRLLRREKRLRMTSKSAPPLPPSPPLVPPRPDFKTAAEKWPDLPYAEYRLSYFEGPSTPPPATPESPEARVATVHPRVPSRLSLRRCTGDAEEEELLKKPKDGAVGLFKRQQSAPRLFFPPDDEDPFMEDSPTECRRLRGATSMGRVPPPPPPRAGSTLTRQGRLPSSPLPSPPPTEPLETDL